MACRPTYVLKVVVFAAHSEAFLRTTSRIVINLPLSGKHILELHHTGIGKQQGSIARWHQGER
jgi:hypothetical protein